jgi:hypothetical protein
LGGAGSEGALGGVPVVATEVAGGDDDERKRHANVPPTPRTTTNAAAMTNAIELPRLGTPAGSIGESVDTGSEVVTPLVRPVCAAAGHAGR